MQARRTSEVPDEAPDSRLEALLEKVKNGKTGTLTHTGFPPGSAGSYKQGWQDFYIIPMNEHFGKVTDLQEF